MSMKPWSIKMKIQKANKLLELIQSDSSIDLEGSFELVVEATRTFRDHYKNNPKGFIEDFITILHGKTNEEVPFILNPAQELLVGTLEGNRWVAAPKARQLGITTLTNALALHHALFTPNANVICMAVKTDNSNENLRRIKAMFKTMPEWVQKTVMYWNEGDGHQNNVGLWSFKSKMTNSNNKLEVSSASSEDATRGKTPTFLHWTETAFSEVAEEIFTSVFPALNRRKDSKIILESTGNGNSGFYYEICMGIRKGFGVVFMPWFLDADYRMEGEALHEDDKEVIRDLMGVKELPDLDDDQLRWYWKTNETIGKAKCQQEYPVDVEQVFQATSSSFFGARTIQKIDPQPPIYAMAIQDGFLSKRRQGACAVWEAPRADYEYLIVADVSEGVEDPSSIMVFNPDGREILHWHELLQPDDIVKTLDSLGKHYGNAKIVVENNGIGQYVLNSLRSQCFYTNLYQEDGKLGVKTHVGSKPVMLSMLQEMILNDKLIFSNPTIADEMKVFQADKLQAQKGLHDDVVMSAAIAAWVFDKAPPKKKRIQDGYRDYTQRVDGGDYNKRQFVLGRRR